MMTDWVFIAIALIGTIFATITDLKNRWVPDFVNYSLIFAGLGGNIVVSAITHSIKPLAFSLAGAGFFYLISLAMFYGGAWGGGDAKLMVGIGALIPTYPAILTSYVKVNSAPWPFAITLWFNALIFGAVFGLIATAWLAIKHRQKVGIELIKTLKKNKLVPLIAPAILVGPAIMFVFNLPTPLAVLWIIGCLLALSLLVTKAVEKVCMYRIIPPTKLVVGDWIIEEIKLLGKIIYKPKKYGIEQEDIDKLIKFEKQGKLKQVKIKEGLPYIPAILAGLLASLFIGDIFFIILEGLL